MLLKLGNTSHFHFRKKKMVYLPVEDNWGGTLSQSSKSSPDSEPAAFWGPMPLHRWRFRGMKYFFRFLGPYTEYHWTPLENCPMWAVRNPDFSNFNSPLKASAVAIPAWAGCHGAAIWSLLTFKSKGMFMSLLHIIRSKLHQSVTSREDVKLCPYLMKALKTGSNCQAMGTQVWNFRSVCYQYIFILIFNGWQQNLKNRLEKHPDEIIINPHTLNVEFALTTNATKVSETVCPWAAHSCPISRIIFLMTLSAWSQDILDKHTG